MPNEERLHNILATDLKHPLRAFWRSELYDELVALEAAVLPGHEIPRREPDIGEDEWRAFMTDFLALIPERETDIAAADLPILTGSLGARALHWRIAQGLSVLGNRLPQRIPDPGAPDILPSPEVLAPMQLRARLELLLATGSIPMLWLRRIDLPQRKPPRERPQRPD
ncbi:MAG: hypothetical protein COW55_07450 [Rhodobacteraceae bacterium CG17_big_fil_post_rev_8_21_14_2_50_65_11]|nr:MAG: hypothetical protein COW55_07450 [Rhodobacteraceae bacterium CG17_big_fil_post_rev_8_21_14_2_50_65_11]